MKYQLTAHEARVIGCLLEKQVTTPEQYPLSVNAVVTACNQKTNREPVMSLSESEVQDLLDTLVKRHYLRTVSGFGNRVTKYEQRFCNSEFGDLKLSAGGSGGGDDAAAARRADAGRTAQPRAADA
jgi:uncharacterized protein YceH (UPF0502 family)